MVDEAVDHDIDGEVPLLAGRTALYVTEPHGWPVDRVGSVTATKGRLTVRFGDYPGIDDDTDMPYEGGEVPRGAAEARALADLWAEAEEILAAYESGAYVPPPALPVYRDNQPRGLGGLWLSGALSYLSGTMNMMGLLDPLEPYTRQEKFTNIWRRMRGLEPIPRRPKGDGGKVTIKLAHYD